MMALSLHPAINSYNNETLKIYIKQVEKLTEYEMNDFVQKQMVQLDHLSEKSRDAIERNNKFLDKFRNYKFSGYPVD